MKLIENMYTSPILIVFMMPEYKIMWTLLEYKRALAELVACMHVQVGGVYDGWAHVMGMLFYRLAECVYPLI